MRLLRQFAAVLLLLGMLSGAVRVYAAPQKDYSEPFFEGRTLDEIMEEFIKRHYTIEGTVGAGYKNLVTGEEYYYMPDKLFLAASTYKVPLNMYWSNRVYQGEIGWDYPIYGSTYEKAMEWSIVNSNNEYSIALWEKLGSFSDFRNLMLPLLGTTVEQVEKEPLFYKENYFSPRMMIHCLEELYTNSEQYPRVIDYMLQAKPGQYFKAHEHEAQIAHKFGYLEESALVVNDSAIVFTEDPIAIVVYTQNAYNGYDWLVDFCDMMIAYTDYYTPIRRQAEEEAAARAEAEAAAARERRLAVFDVVAAETGVNERIACAVDGAAAEFEAAVSGLAIARPEPVEEEPPEDRSLAVFITAAAAGLAGIILLVISLAGRRRTGAGIAGAAVLLAAGGLLVFCAVKPAGQPENIPVESPESALNAFALPAEEMTGGTPEEMLRRFIRSSFDCTVLDEPRTDGNTAVLRIQISTADCSLLKSTALAYAAEEMNAFRSELAAEEAAEPDDGRIRSRMNAVAAEAIEKAVNSAPLKTMQLELELIFLDGSWQIVQSPELSAALSTARTGGNT